jgi:hypothetical protein
MAGVYGDFDQVELPLAAVRHASTQLAIPDLSSNLAFVYFREVTTSSAQARNFFIRAYRARTGLKAGDRWEGEVWKAPVPHPDTALLIHELRVDDFHCEPFVVTERVESTYGVEINGTIAPIRIGPTTFKARMPGALFNDSKPRVGLFTGGTDGAQDGDLCALLSETREFVVQSSSVKIAELLTGAGTDNVPELARRQLENLDRYREWFDGRFAAKS